MSYPHLFQSGTIGHLHIRNRIALPPMGTNFAGTDGVVSDRNVRYYRERARGGVGLIIVEAAYIDKTTKHRTHGIGACEDRFIPGLRRLAHAIRAEGAVAAIQLAHNGRLVSSKTTGYATLAPSAIAHRVTGEVPREMTIDDIRYIAGCYAVCAGRVAEAGFDAVELHGAHGYLLQQFLSPFSNRRTDEYGGSFAGRARFPLEVVRAVRARVGRDFPILYRLSATEFMDGGLTPEETGAFAQLLESEGIAALHVTAGVNETPYSMAHAIQPMYFEPGNLAQYARGMKAQVRMPVIAVGRINHPQVAEAILARGDADFVATGRALIADPHWPQKAVAGRSEEIRQCIGCNAGCIGRLMQQFDITCVQNPWVGMEWEAQLPPAAGRKRVVVIGGGPAGLEAAHVAAARGHQVTLLEEQARLGGQVRLAQVPPGKAELEEVIRWRIRELNRLGADVKCGVRAGVEDISRSGASVVLEADGAGPAMMAIATDCPERVVSAWSVLAGGKVPGRRVLVIGGGMVGLETADFLAAHGKSVVVIEVLDEIGQTITPTARAMLLERLQEQGVEIITGVSLDKWGSGGAVIRKKDDSTARIEGIEDVVIAVGSVPNRIPVEPRDLAGVVWKRVGDCERPRNLLESVREAAQVAADL